MSRKIIGNTVGTPISAARIGQELKPEINKHVANALKGTASGEVVAINDISPIEHDLLVKVSSKNLAKITGYSTVNPRFYGHTAETQPKYGTAISTKEAENSVVITQTQFKNPDVTVDATNGSFYIDIEDISVVEGETITISFDVEITERPTELLGVSFNMGLLSSGEGQIFSRPFAIGADATKARISQTTSVHGIYPYWEIRVAGCSCIVSNLQIEKNATATAYTPYVADIGTVKVKAQGKNLMNKELWTTPVEGVLVQEGDVYTLTWTNDVRYTNTFPFYIPANTTITVSIEHVEINMDDNIATRHGTVYIQLYDADEKTPVVGVQLEKDAPIKTVTITKDVYYSQLFLTSLASKGDSVKFKNLQVEVGTAATEYETYIEPVEYEAGTVEGIKSIYPCTTLTTDTSGVLIECEYNRDINKAFAELQQAIISLGGNI